MTGNGLLCCIGIQAIQQVVDNARQQLQNCSVEQLFDAFLYYYDNDDFIEFLRFRLQKKEKTVESGKMMLYSFMMSLRG